MYIFFSFNLILIEFIPFITRAHVYMIRVASYTSSTDCQIHTTQAYIFIKRLCLFGIYAHACWYMEGEIVCHFLFYFVFISYYSFSIYSMPFLPWLLLGCTTQVEVVKNFPTCSCVLLLLASAPPPADIFPPRFPPYYLLLLISFQPYFINYYFHWQFVCKMCH